MDMIKADLDPAKPAPLLDCLKAVLGLLKKLLKGTTIECVKNTFGLLVSHFSTTPFQRVSTRIAAYFEEVKIPEVAEEYHDIAESIVNDLDL